MGRGTEDAPQGRRVAAAVHGLDEIAHVRDPDDLVERFTVHRMARVRRCEHALERLLERRAGPRAPPLRARPTARIGGYLLHPSKTFGEHVLLAVLDLALVGQSRSSGVRLHLGVSSCSAPGGFEAEHADRLPRSSGGSSRISAEAAEGRATARAAGPLARSWTTIPFGTSLADHDVQVRWGSPAARGSAAATVGSAARTRAPASQARPRAPIPGGVDRDADCIAGVDPADWLVHPAAGARPAAPLRSARGFACAAR